MPYKCEKIKLKGMQDRRRKLTDIQKSDIRNLYSTGDFSLNNLARMYEVSKKTILLTVNPESKEKSKEYQKENWRNWQRTGEEWNKIQREHRKYKQKLYLAGELVEQTDKQKIVK